MLGRQLGHLPRAIINDTSRTSISGQPIEAKQRVVTETQSGHFHATACTSLNRDTTIIIAKSDWDCPLQMAVHA